MYLHCRYVLVLRLFYRWFAVAGFVTLIAGCSMRQISPSYEVRHSNLGADGDLKQVTVTDSKTRFVLTGAYTILGVGSVFAGLPFYVVPLYGAAGLLFDIGFTPYMYRDRAWLYDCSGEGNVGSFPEISIRPILTLLPF